MGLFKKHLEYMKNMVSFKTKHLEYFKSERLVLRKQNHGTEASDQTAPAHTTIGSN